ncbi:hypothetical protein ACSQ67_008548 [Phaseolus vulgaris]
MYRVGEKWREKGGGRRSTVLFLKLVGNLRYFNISEKSFGTSLLASIWNATNLVIFFATSSNITDQNPYFIRCHRLYKLELQGNFINGTIPWDIGHCQKLITWYNPLAFNPSTFSGLGTHKDQFRQHFNHHSRTNLRSDRNLETLKEKKDSHKKYNSKQKKLRPSPSSRVDIEEGGE